MIARFSIVMVLFCHTAIGGDVLDLQRVRSSDDLARFIHSIEINNTALRALLKGLDSTNSMKVAPYTKPIPVREIYGAIVQVNYADALGAGFYERDKKYPVREICAFRDKSDVVWRYQITIFEDRQYRLMKDLLMRKISGAASNHQLQRPALALWGLPRPAGRKPLSFFRYQTSREVFEAIEG